MMLFPLGGGKGHELSAHFYTLNVHNPAVVKAVMQDAFDYMRKYHGIYTACFLPRVHVQPSLQTEIGRAVSGQNSTLHPSWSSYIDLVQRKQTKIERKRRGLTVRTPGSKFLTMVICKQQRTYGQFVCMLCVLCICCGE